MWDNERWGLRQDFQLGRNVSWPEVTLSCRCARFFFEKKFWEMSLAKSPAWVSQPSESYRLLLGFLDSKHAPHLKSGRVTFRCTAPGSPDDFTNNNQGLHSLSYQLADRMPECWPFVLKCHLGFLKRWLFLFIYHRFGMDCYGTS